MGIAYTYVQRQYYGTVNNSTYDNLCILLKLYPENTDNKDTITVISTLFISVVLVDLCRVINHLNLTRPVGSAQALPCSPARGQQGITLLACLPRGFL
jgi:hypothetical protein